MTGADEPIFVDDEASWPQSTLRNLAALEGGIRAYHRERRRIDAAAEKKVELRINRPRNSNQAAWNEALRVSEEGLQGSAIVGFHATRLTLEEIASVSGRGLVPLSTVLLTDRVAALLATGGIAANQAEMLLAHHQARDSNRAGMTWFCFSRSLLREESGINRLMRSWGGEALYNSHESDPMLGPLLRGIGVPCVVIAHVNVGEVEAFASVGERLLNAWAFSRGITIADRPEFEGYVRSGPVAVERIIRLGDPEFNLLTNHLGWRKPL